jgi:hypothetical protein
MAKRIWTLPNQCFEMLYGTPWWALLAWALLGCAAPAAELAAPTSAGPLDLVASANRATDAQRFSIRPSPLLVAVGPTTDTVLEVRVWAEELLTSGASLAFATPHANPVPAPPSPSLEGRSGSGFVLTRWLPDGRVMFALTVISLLMMVVALFLVPLVIGFLPADYFVRPDPPRPRWGRQFPVLYFLWLCFRNLIGAVFLLVGFVQLFTPGQGLLCMLVGLSLMVFPGKRKIEAWILANRMVLTAINAIRRRYGKPPVLSPFQKPASLAAPSTRETSRPMGVAGTEGKPAAP